jgi:flagellar basal-body rod protein FlgB
MLLTDVVNRETLPVLEKALAYTEARHRMLAENIANVDTPGYRTKHLDTRGFQDALQEALARRKEDPSGAFRLAGAKEFTQDRYGHLAVTPSEEPPENVLFHDGTNARLERQMAMLAENGMMHQVLVELMKGRFTALQKAIRGTVG